MEFGVLYDMRNPRSSGISNVALYQQTLEHIEQMEALDLEGVEPTSHVVGLENVLREDVPRPSLPVEKALEPAPDPQPGGFGVPSPGRS